MNKRNLLGLGCALVLLLTAMLTGCGDGTANGDKNIGSAMSTLQAVKDRGNLRVAVLVDSPPMSYKDGNTWKGFDVELAKRMAKDLLGQDNKLTIVPVQVNDRAKVLEEGQVDIVLANYTVTKERSEKVDFVGAYMRTGVSVLSRDGRVKNLEDIGPKGIGVSKGTIAEEDIKTNYSDMTIVTADSDEAMFDLLQNGTVEAVACDILVAYGWVIDHPEYDVGIKMITAKEQIAAAVAKGNTTLGEWVQNEVMTLRSERFFDACFMKIMSPYYGNRLQITDVLL